MEICRKILKRKRITEKKYWTETIIRIAKDNPRKKRTDQQFEEIKRKRNKEWNGDNKRRRKRNEEENIRWEVQRDWKKELRRTEEEELNWERDW